MTDERPALRFLLACPACARQFDAGALPPGSLFHCSCGGTIRVPRVAARDAAVARCGSCGAPRAGQGATCASCGSDFTLHERDLHTICPACATRISDRARFCHHCGVPIAPQGRAGEPTASPCPACDGGRTLCSRRLGVDGVAVLECPACAGLWLSREAFELVAERARAVAAAAEPDAGGETAPAPPAAPEPRGAARGGPLYRRCPQCAKMMHRRNFGRGSRVILDTCKDHGLWFDLRELEQVLAWIRGGGEARELRLTQQEQAESRTRLDHVFDERLERLAGRPERSWFDPREDSRPGGGDLLGRVLGALFEI